MSPLSFAGDMARLQQAIAESHDLVVRRGIVLGTLNLRPGERVLELGCGGGYYTVEAGRFVGPTGRVCAIDISPDQIAAAQARCAELAWVECREADIAAPPYGDAEFDFVFAVQALEYLADLDGALRQIHRVLRIGGRLIVVATDWSSAVWHSGKCAADGAGADRLGSAYAMPRSAGHPGGTASPRGDPAPAAGGDPDPEHVL